jgi:hypothetical protein
VFAGAVMSFVVGSAILRVYPVRGQDEEETTAPSTTTVPVATPA